MKKLIAIGEALIDFIPSQSGCGIKDVKQFSPIVGGAPANVCGAFTKLGGQSSLITQLGSDPFGDKIVEELSSYGIDCGYISRTKEANTSLAFVALQEDGNREFSFYRKTGADMILRAEQVQEKWFEESFCLHFCSVSLGEYPMKEAHKKAIAYAKAKGALISFDPNVRLPLWEDQAALREVILEFLSFADILKISDEELAFITGEEDMERAKEQLFCGDVKLILYTKGKEGAEAYTNNEKVSVSQETVKAVDTTGAGDAFIGSFLYQLAKNQIGKKELAQLSKEQLQSFLTFSNAYCKASVTKHGAIASYLTAAEIKF